jgi:hypothetical protein
MEDGSVEKRLRRPDMADVTVEGRGIDQEEERDGGFV